MVSQRRNSQLAEAIALLINNQAQFLLAMSRMDERFSRMDERFSHVESELADIKAILIRHEQMLQALPEAVRQKVGFKQPR